MRIIKEDKLNYNNPEMKKLRNAVRGIVVDNDEQFISLVDSIINDEPINYVPETRKLKNAINSLYVDSDEELRKWVLNVAKDQGVISGSPVNESINLDEIQKGDLVDFGSYGKLYVCDPYYHDKYFWVTDDKDERYNEKALGWSMFKDDAQSIIYDEEDDKNEDY